MMKTLRHTQAVIFVLILAILIFASTGFCDDTLVATETGNVGIGTNDPGNELDIKSNATGSSVLTIERSGTAGTEPNIFSVSEDASGNAGMSLNQSDGTTAIHLNAGSGDSYINNGGNVGIGMNDPAVRLNIKSGATPSNVLAIENSGTIGTGSNIFIVREDGNGGGRLYLKQSDGTTAIQLTADNASYINSGGRVGIGTSSPVHDLDVVDSNHVASIRAQSTVSAAKLFLDAASGTTSRIYFDEGGESKFQLYHDANREVMALAEHYDTPTETVAWYPNGNMHISGTFYQASDERFKEDIHALKTSASSPLDDIKKLRGVTYKWQDKEKDKSRQIGLIAQELEAVYPEMVSTDEDGHKSIAYSRLTVPLIEAVKELKTENDSLSSRLDAMEKENAALKARLEKVEKKLFQQK